MEDGSLATVAYSFLAAGVGAYLGSYLKKRAEVLATREDFDEIKRQLRETTLATEEVRSRVSSEFWLTQERWRLKRDLYLSLLQSLEEGTDIFRQVSMLIEDRQDPSKTGTQDVREQYTERFERVRAELRKARATASLVSDGVANLIVELERTTNESAASPNWREALAAVVSAFEETYRRVVEASRQDLRLTE